jgi:hypothetical protein
MMIFLRSLFNPRCQKKPEETAPLLHPCILSGDIDGLRRHINSLVLAESELNDLLVQSLRHADQPLIIYMLLKSGADPLAKIQDTEDRPYNIAIQNNRGGALLEMMRTHDGIPIKDSFADCKSFSALREKIKQAPVKNFSNIVDNAIAKNYPLSLLAAFSCLKHKRFFNRGYCFTKQQGGDAVAVMIANGFNTVAFDMIETGFDIKDGTLYKNPSRIPCLDINCRKNLEDCIAGTLQAPRVLTPKEKIRELRISYTTSLMHLPYCNHP